MTKFLNKFEKIRLKINEKIPAGKWQERRFHHQTVDNTKYNVGIPCGSVNGFFVLDIDIKDNGYDEFKKYLGNHGEPNTLTIKTPSGGMHYYFNLKTSNIESAGDTNFIINQVIYNRSKKGGVGIDIRSTGGYIVAPPSSIDGISYEVINETSINDLPKELGDYLLKLDLMHKLNMMVKDEIKVSKENTNKETSDDEHITLYDNHFTNNYKYEIDDATIMKLLKMLSPEYLNNFELWFKITTVLKSLNAIRIWKDWSKQSINYDSVKNKRYWNIANPFIDINYLVYVLRSAGNKIDYIRKYKKYDPLTKDNFYNKKIENNANYVSELLSNEDFNVYDTIIIKSCTGTGKTTAVAQCMEEYLKDDGETKFLTLTTRTTLTDQHEKSFQNINLQNYQKCDVDDCRHLSICLNSLHKLKMKDIENYVVYIDEIASFLEFTHNDTLDNNIQTIYTSLIDIVKNAKKVIVSDALITDNVINFLKHRRREELTAQRAAFSSKMTTLYINNSFKKYEGVKAYRIRDEEKLLNQLLTNIENKEYFLFGCDSCDTITKLYHHCLSKARDEEKNDYILITADTDYAIVDASKQFENKYVFYSPKITFGLDFSYDLQQDVFIYVKGRTINPYGIFQQTTRTRNIKQIYFYCETFNLQEKYKTMEELRGTIRDTISKSHILNTLCVAFDENDERKIIENTFFNLFLYNEYANDVLNTDKYLHFRDILINNGISVEELYEPKKLRKDTRDEMTEVIENISEELFNEFLKEDTNKMDSKFDNINTNLYTLGLIGKGTETIKQYKDIITNKYLLTEHFNIMRLLKSDAYIKDRLEKKGQTCYKTKLVRSTEHKILLLRELEEYYNIGRLEVDFNKGADMFGEHAPRWADTFNNIKYVFETKKKPPTNQKELKELYVFMLKQLGNKEMITSTRSKKKEDRDTTHYKINDRFINYHIELSKHYTNNYKHYLEEVINKYGLPVIENKPVHEDIESLLFS